MLMLKCVQGLIKPSQLRICSIKNLNLQGFSNSRAPLTLIKPQNGCPALLYLLLGEGEAILSLCLLFSATLINLLYLCH